MAKLTQVVASDKEKVTDVELGQDAAQAPHVDRRAAPFAEEQLGGHVVQSVYGGFVCAVKTNMSSSALYFLALKILQMIPRRELTAFCREVTPSVVADCYMLFSVLSEDQYVVLKK